MAIANLRQILNKVTRFTKSSGSQRRNTIVNTVRNIRASNINSAPFGSYKGRRFVGGTLPLGAGGATRAVGTATVPVRSAVGRLFSSGVTTIRGAFTPTTLKTLGPKLGASAIGISLPFIGYDVMTSKNPIQFAKKLAGQTKEISSLAISPVGGLFGLAQNKGIDLYGGLSKGAQDLYGSFFQSKKNASLKLPDINYPTGTYNVNYPEIRYPTFSPNFTVTAPEMQGLGGGGFGSSVNVSAGGGGDFGMTSALLLALAGGGAGYLLGRRKKSRRRKKYKRSRRR